MNPALEIRQTTGASEGAYLVTIINVHLCNPLSEGIVRRSEPSAAMHAVLGGSEKEKWPSLGIYASRNVCDQAWVSSEALS